MQCVRARFLKPFFVLPSSSHRAIPAQVRIEVPKEADHPDHHDHKGTEQKRHRARERAPQSQPKKDRRPQPNGLGDQDYYRLPAGQPPREETGKPVGEFRLLLWSKG
jgi:hypothetical protein